MKKRKIINVVVIALILLNILVFILVFRVKESGTNISPISKSNENDVPAAYKVPPKNGEKSVADSGDYDSRDSSVPFDVSQVVKKGAVGESRGIEYQVDMIQIAKEPVLEGFIGVATEEIERNQAGKILNDYSYVMIDLTVTNTLEELNVMYLNSVRITGVDEHNKIVQDNLFHCGWTEDYIKIPQMETNVKDKSYYRMELKAKETQKFKCLYIQKDEEINNLKLYLWVFPAGAGSSENYYDRDNLFLEL